MRITVRRNNPRCLELMLRPLLAPAYWIAGALFIALGLVVVWFMARSLSLDCSRARKTCEIREWRVLKLRRLDVPVAKVRGARVVTETHGLVATMTLVLETDAGDRRLNLVKADGAAKEALAWDIWHFTQDSTVAEFRYADDARLPGWFLGLFLVGAGLTCLLALERVRVRFDRERGEARISRRRWLGSGVTVIPLADVRDAEAREFRVNQASSYGVMLRLEGGREESLTRLPMFTRSSASHAMGLLGSWLEGRPA